MKKYIAIKPHTSEYPDPITFTKGTRLEIGEKYEGPENWDNWYLCSTPEKQEGWVPKEVVRWLNSNQGIATENYTARELNVLEGAIVVGSKILNGWLWCKEDFGSELGWVPMENLELIE